MLGLFASTEQDSGGADAVGVEYSKPARGELGHGARFADWVAKLDDEAEIFEGDSFVVSAIL